tara:strand:- start:908 stop:1615 length:708 start_codon:yes stop_codon:yes gene_type:complete
MAAQAGVRESNKLFNQYCNSNILGFSNILNLSKTNNIKNFIYASSSSVYSGNRIPFSESCTDIQPNSFYGVTKKINEDIAKFFSDSSFRTIGLRFFTVYGPYGRPDMAYYNFTKKLKSKSYINLFDKGLMVRDMTYIDDVTDSIISCIEYFDKKKFDFEVFNIGGGEKIKTIDLLNRIANHYNITPKILFKNSSNETKKTESCLKKSHIMLGYKPKVNLNKGLKNFYDWFDNFYR